MCEVAGCGAGRGRGRVVLVSSVGFEEDTMKDDARGNLGYAS